METVDLTNEVQKWLSIAGIHSIKHLLTEGSESFFQGIGSDERRVAERVDVLIQERNAGAYVVRIIGENSLPLESGSTEKLREALLGAALKWESRHGQDVNCRRRVPLSS